MYNTENPNEDLSISETYEIDFSSGVQATLTLTEATSLTLTNFKKNAVISIVITGDFTLALPSECTGHISGDDYDGTVNNMVVFNCIDDTTSAEVVWCSITNATV